MVQFQAVSKVYARAARGRVEALAGASFEVKPGELVVVSGPAGAGKSTLLRLVTGEERPTRGTVTVAGEEPGRLGRRGLARLRRELGVVSEARALLPDRTAFGNVALVLRALGTPRGETRARALEVLGEAGLAGQRNALPAELTEAERLRLCLARALAGEPRLLVVDEPTRTLDDGAQAEVVALLRRRHEQGTTILLAAGAPDLAERLGGRALALDRGHLRAAGGAD